jgi:hypothetical protein
VLNFIKVVIAFLGVCSIGFLLARWADQLVQDTRVNGSFVAQSAQPVEDLSPVDEIPERPIDGQMEAIVGSFLESQEKEGGFTLGRKLSALNLDELEEFYIEALSFDLEDRRAFEAAGLALQSIASQDPRRALELLYSLTPSEKARLATALSGGWAKYDAVSAWDWIDSAWIDESGEYIDRDLQNEMFHGTLEVVLSEQRNYQLAADLLKTVMEPGLRLELADLIAFHVVSENPAQTLNQLDFTSDDLVDSAIMDAVIDEWAQRDSRGAMTWTLENQDQVTSKGARFITKDLILNEVYQDLERFHSNLQSPFKRDSVASESARLFARRNPDISISWLAAIESSASKYGAYYDSLYEIGHDDFDSTVRFAELAYGVANLDREEALFGALQGWSVIDPDKVHSYLNSSDALNESDRLSSLVNTVY